MCLISSMWTRLNDMQDEIYVGRLVSDNYLAHYGVGHLNGGHSGRFPWGSGKRPMQSRTAGSLASIGGKWKDSIRRFGSAITLGQAAVVAVMNPAAFLTVQGAIKIPGIVMSGKLAADSIMAIHKNNKIERRKRWEPKDKLTKFSKKKREFTMAEDCKDVNPLYKTKESDKTHNCVFCSVAYDMRRRGFDVTAKPSYDGHRETELLKWYPKAKLKSIDRNRGTEGGVFSKEKYVRETISELTKQGNGARGCMTFDWDLPVVSTNFKIAHNVAYEVQDGKVLILDAQSGKISSDTTKFLKHTNDITYVRLDNVDYDPKKIKECCQ